MRERIDHVRVQADSQGEWYWHRTDGDNGKVLSGSTESYTKRSHALDQAFELNADIDTVEVLFPDGLLDVITRAQHESDGSDQ